MTTKTVSKERETVRRARKVGARCVNLSKELEVARQERNELIVELIEMDYSEREVGRIVGLAGPRVNAIYNASL